MRTKEEQPLDRGVRKLAAKLALSGGTRHAGEYFADWQPYCDDPVTVHRHVKAGGFDRSIAATIKAPCRKCAKCLQFRQMKWRERALVECHHAPRTWFITLTFSPVHLAGVLIEARSSALKDVDAAAYKHVQRYLKRLRKIAKIRFLAVYERGEQTGRSHYHLLVHEVNRPIPKRELESRWISHVHARLVDLATPGAASYITKYTTKAADIRPRASARYGRPPF